jgi:hypothetical protein
VSDIQARILYSDEFESLDAFSCKASKYINFKHQWKNYRSLNRIKTTIGSLTLERLKEYHLFVPTFENYYLLAISAGTSI